MSVLSKKINSSFNKAEIEIAQKLRYSRKSAHFVRFIIFPVHEHKHFPDKPNTLFAFYFLVHLVTWQCLR